MALPVHAGIDVGGTFTDAVVLDETSRLPYDRAVPRARRLGLTGDGFERNSP